MAAIASAQWEILPSPTAADLRGIHDVGHGIAWASGTQGAVLRTTNDGKDWQRCTTPPDAEKLDFRGIQAFDAKTAIVMSSGKGPLSRLYKTTDACQTWTLLFTNPDPEGFWDALQFTDRQNGYLLGDPVFISNLDGTVFPIFRSADGGQTWNVDQTRSFQPINPDAAIFAASNSSMLIHNGVPIFVTGGSRVNLFLGLSPTPSVGRRHMVIRLPMAQGASAGGFSLGSKEGGVGVVVGGDYSMPNEASYNAVYSADGGFFRWEKAQTLPHGYRSAVAYHAASKTWITVGPNGTDTSIDDGRNWHALKPSASEPPDADQHWNALSLPFVVGPHGRIGRLRPAALKRAPAGARP
jgi:photosystem II stability/assembly factor-like uncharacterized protein